MASKRTQTLRLEPGRVYRLEAKGVEPLGHVRLFRVERTRDSLVLVGETIESGERVTISLRKA